MREEGRKGESWGGEGGRGRGDVVVGRSREKNRGPYVRRAKRHRMREKGRKGERFGGGGRRRQKVEGKRCM
jgi:hypothetical protein